MYGGGGYDHYKYPTLLYMKGEYPYGVYRRTA